MYVSRPYGSTTNGHFGTDDGSPWNAIDTRRIEASSRTSTEKSNVEILASLRKAANMMSMQDKTNYWMSDEAQSELLRRIDTRAKKPVSSLSLFDYSSDAKAMLSSAAFTNDGDEWIEVELTADTGACDTVMPRPMAQCIPIQPSLQSLSSMIYEVADGNKIPNPGERRCVM